MAATDQTFRNQKTLDLIFGVSGLVMLATIVWMFADDYFRKFKPEQRAFRDVEAAMATRSLIDLLPHPLLSELRAAEEAKDESRVAELKGELNKFFDRFAEAEKELEAAKKVEKEKKAENAAKVHAA